jgi:hypothetical protein
LDNNLPSSFDKVFSLGLFAPVALFSIAALLVWRYHDSTATVQATAWRRILTMIGLSFLTVDALITAGYLLNEFLGRRINFSAFNTCSNIGALSCAVAVLASLAGKGLLVRLTLLFGALSGLMFWFLQIGPRY